MSVAADVAREWNQREQSKGDVPSVPDALRTRFDAIWAEAVVLARAEHAAEREGWQQRLTQLEAERDALTDDLAKAEDALDSAVTDAKVQQQEAQQLAERARAEAEQRAQLTADELAGERSRADRAEARAEALVEERDRLIGERDRATQEARESRKPSKG